MIQLLDSSVRLAEEGAFSIDLVGEIYGGWNGDSQTFLSKEEITNKMRTSFKDFEELANLIRLSVGRFYLVVKHEDACHLLTAIDSRVFYCFSQANLWISSDQNQIFSKSSGQIDIDLAFLYVLKQTEATHKTLMTDCYVVPCATHEQLALNERTRVTRKCMLYAHYSQKYLRTGVRTCFDSSLDAAGRIYSSHVEGKPVTIALSGVDSANAGLSMLVNGTKMDAVVADNYSLQTQVAKSMSALLESRYSFTGLNIVDGGLWNSRLDDKLASELEQLYSKTLYLDFSAWHTGIPYMSALKNGCYLVKGDMLSTGRTANLHHTSLYKGSYYKSHLFGFSDRAIYTMEFMSFMKLRGKNPLNSIIDSFAYPGRKFDSDYREIINHRGELLFEKAVSIYRSCVIGDAECDFNSSEPEEQMFIIQYLITKYRYFIAGLSTDRFASREYGFTPVNVFADGPGAHFLLGHFDLHLWNALNPKQVVYDYYRKKTGESFRKTVKRVLNRVPEDERKAFVSDVGLTPVRAKWFNSNYWNRRIGKLRNSISKRLGHPPLVSSAPIHQRTQFVHYMREMWMHYRNRLDLRSHCTSNPIILDYFSRIIRQIENEPLTQSGECDRFVNLTVYLSQFKR